MRKQVDIIKELFAMQDKRYRDFHSKLIPAVDKDTVIGIRVPVLRGYAKRLIKENRTKDFLNSLPHKYYDENQLHALIINEINDYEICMEEVIRFLPYIDNWATCDALLPKIFKNHHKELLGHIKIWISSDKTYTVRFGIGMLMVHFLDEDFDISYPRLVTKIRSDEYYINMMIAWYFATALAKQYDAIIPFIEKRKLDRWTHNKTIQKAIESYRITSAQKEYLRGLKI